MAKMMSPGHKLALAALLPGVIWMGAGGGRKKTDNTELQICFKVTLEHWSVNLHFAIIFQFIHSNFTLNDFTSDDNAWQYTNLMFYVV